MRILVTNDDGIGASGLAALHDALAEWAEVWVVAPDREQSATSHAITFARPLRIRSKRPRWFEVDGTPTDCVYLALHHVMQEAKPTLVCSGINRGPNLGSDVFYSGTVAAAMEGALHGVPSIAFSAESFDALEAHAVFASRFAKRVAAMALPPGTLLNVNFPEAETRRFAFTRLGRRNYGSGVEAKTDPRGQPYYWIGGSGVPGYEAIASSDCEAVFDQKRISITPLHLDLTNEKLLEELQRLDLGNGSDERDV